MHYRQRKPCKLYVFSRLFEKSHDIVELSMSATERYYVIKWLEIEHAL